MVSCKSHTGALSKVESDLSCGMVSAGCQHQATNSTHHLSAWVGCGLLGLYLRPYGDVFVPHDQWLSGGYMTLLILVLIYYVLKSHRKSLFLYTIVVTMCSFQPLAILGLKGPRWMFPALFVHQRGKKSTLGPCNLHWFMLCYS